MDSITNYVADMVKVYLRKDIAQRIFEKEAISYSRWAAKELYSELMHSCKPPLAVLERFRDKMTVYAGFSHTAAKIFTTAKDTAEYFIRLLT